MNAARLFVKTAVMKRFTKHYSGASQPELKVLSSPGATAKVEVKGWVKSLRKLKELVFFDISDGSSAKKLQVTVRASEKPEKLNVGASVIVKGHLGKTPNGLDELQAEEITIPGPCDLAGYPFLPRKKYPSEYVRQYLHLRPRTNKFAALLRVRSRATCAIHEHLTSEGFINIHTPILTSNDCEGAGEIFRVVPENKEMLKSMRKEGKTDDEAYFNCKTYLTVSGQLHLEAAAHGLSKVYTFGPTFRAENSRSRLHLSEFYMLEAETAFTDRIEDLVVTIEKLLKNVTQKVIHECVDDIEICKDDIVEHDWTNKTFPVITYGEAKQILEKNPEKFSGKFKEEIGFTKEQELFLVRHCGNVPTFVINWPKHMKPFYMRDCENDRSSVSALDLLAPTVGEVAGGSLRENSYEKLKERLCSQEQLNWYLELRKFGGVPTAGFGLGFERYLQMLLAVNNIKDTIPFPRWPHNCSL